MKNIYQIILSNNHQMIKIKAIIDEIANKDIAVLIKGEVGAGKELLAEAIHLNSNRKHKPFVKVDCPLHQNGALQIKLFEFEENTFTGIHSPKFGKFDSLDGGTILLNNITEMDIPLQKKVLQVFQNGVFFDPGKNGNEKVYPRVIATTANQLDKSMMERQIHDDLLSEVNLLTINVPPLRDRQGQIFPLLEYYFNFYKEKYGKEQPTFSSKLINILKTYAWPGNIRELENMVKDIVINGGEDAILQTFSIKRLHIKNGLEFYDNSSKNHIMEKKLFTLKDVKKQAVQNAEEVIIRDTLQQTRWNRRQATKLLGISYNALLYKIKKYNLT